MLFSILFFATLIVLGGMYFITKSICGSSIASLEKEIAKLNEEILEFNKARDEFLGASQQEKQEIIPQ
jgi:prefoldin subunit 5